VTASASLDGRRLRRSTNRAAVIDALLSLFAEGVYQPSANEIAERAGISPRSLFRYFDDVRDLSRAAIEHELTKARLVEPDIDPDAPTKTKIADVVHSRVNRYEAIAPAARAARIAAHRNPVVAQQLHQQRAHLRHELRRLFAPELDRSGNNDTTLAAIDALCSFETYDLMRTSQNLSKAKSAAAIETALTALLGEQR